LGVCVLPGGLLTSTAAMMMMMERWAEKAIPQTHIFTPSVACLGAIYRLPLLYPAPSHIVFPFHSRKARMRVLLGVRVKSGSLMGTLHTVWLLLIS